MKNHRPVEPYSVQPFGKCARNAHLIIMAQSGLKPLHQQVAQMRADLAREEGRA